jgi:hypothetical protein
MLDICYLKTIAYFKARPHYNYNKSSWFKLPLVPMEPMINPPHFFNKTFSSTRNKFISKRRAKKIRKSSTSLYYRHNTFYYHIIQNFTLLLPFIFTLPTVRQSNIIQLSLSGNNFKNVYSKISAIPLKSAGSYFNGNYNLWKYDRLNYLKTHYNIKDTNHLLYFIISNWAFLDHPKALPYRFQKNPW